MMARMIDADRLLRELTALSHGQVWPGWTYDGIRLLIERQPTITPPNEPLTLEQHSPDPDMERDCGLFIRAQRWIPVEERLPPRKEPVLICFTDGKMEVGFWHDQDEDLTYWCGCVNDGYLEELDCDPTHWMPLPELPEREGV